ncbi:MAG TPA: LamG domain-containing protein, partial [Candidatus Nitrosotalea sp.]|nr:LamG domain-containing protein [Candidatus Nitrosotalea sp.]
MKNRRGLSTVVGAVFAVIAISSTIAYVTYSMNTLSQYNNAVITKDQQLQNTNLEKFLITGVTVPNNKFNITVANTGSLPINITKVWVQNTTTTDWDYGYSTSSIVAPGATLTNLGQALPVKYNPSNAYNVKVVTSRGNSYQFS